MKEYKSIRTEAGQFPKVATDEAITGDWRVLTVLPAKYVPFIGTSGLDLTEIVVIFERGN